MTEQKNYQSQVDEMVKTNNLTDYEMQLWLHKQGHKLYDDQLGNDVDIQKMYALANQYGFTWVESKDVWIKESQGIYLTDKTLTERGFAIYKFEDAYGTKCSLQKSSLASDQAVWLGVDDPNPQVLVPGKGWIPYIIPDEVFLATRMHLTREGAKEIIKALQVFVDTGEL